MSVFVVIVVCFVVLSNRAAVIVVLGTPVSTHLASGIFIVDVWAGGACEKRTTYFLAFSIPRLSNIHL